MSRGFQPVYSPAPRRGAPAWLVALVGLVVLVVVVAVVIMVLSGNRPTASPGPTTGGGSPAASATPSGAPTDGSASPGPTASAGLGTPGPTEPGPSGPPPSVDPALAAQIDAVTAGIPGLRELDRLADVPYEFIGREAFRDQLLDLYHEEVPAEVRQAEERMLKRLGLLPDDASLDELILDLYGAQVAAFYRPDNGRFYLVERDEPFGPIDQIITAHEFAHALQDQHFDIDGTRVTDTSQGDAALAQLAVLEGDATLVSQLWAVRNMTQAEMLEIVTESLAGLDEQSLEGMPQILRRQLEFPYTDGFIFVADIYGLGGFEAVDQAHRDPPDSTEQILHSDKYYAGEAPFAVSLNDISGVLGGGWQRTFEQTMGELVIQVLVAGGEEPDVAIPGLPVDWPRAEVAAGWGGDRLNMYETADGGWAIAWQTAWDTQADADEFRVRLAELSTTFDGVSSVVAGADAMTVSVLIASDQPTLDALDAAL